MKAKSHPKQITDRVKQIVAAHFDITTEQLSAHTRARSTSWPRQIAMALCYGHGQLTQRQIATAFGLEHTSVIHAVRHVRDMCDTGEDKGVVMEISRALAATV